MNQEVIVANLSYFQLTIGRDFSVSVQVSLLAFLALFLVVISCYAIFAYVRKNFGKSLEIDQATFGIGDQSITLKPNHNDRQIAYKIWVELSTRKIGLTIDLTDDVIIEIYNSWYDFFSVTRELIKDIPVTKYRQRSTKNIVEMSVGILNYGIRPHLTTWQARFRWWYDNQLKIEGQMHQDPQELQKQFPEYEKLKSDLTEVNKILIAYRKKMEELISA